MERDIVRKMIPGVAVPEVPNDPSLYSRVLLAAGYFEASNFSDEDKIRNQTYKENLARSELKKSIIDIDAYLSSLDMQSSMTPFDEIGMKRIAQLVSKSNQFNLTTVTYSET